MATSTFDDAIRRIRLNHELLLRTSPATSGTARSRASPTAPRGAGDVSSTVHPIASGTARSRASPTAPRGAGDVSSTVHPIASGGAGTGTVALSGGTTPRTSPQPWNPAPLPVQMAIPGRGKTTEDVIRDGMEHIRPDIDAYQRESHVKEVSQICNGMRGTISIAYLKGEQNTMWMGDSNGNMFTLHVMK